MQQQQQQQHVSDTEDGDDWGDVELELKVSETNQAPQVNMFDSERQTWITNDDVDDFMAEFEDIEDETPQLITAVPAMVVQLLTEQEMAEFRKQEEEHYKWIKCII